jgi:hypothetical protein
MAAFVAFVGTLLLSLVVSLIAGLQLGDFFGSGDEFLPVLGYLLMFGTATLVIFAIGYRLAPSFRALNLLAFALAMLALAAPATPGMVHRIAEQSTNPYAVGIERTYIKIELLVPALLAVLVQWGLIRHRWLRVRGQEELTLWPWMTTAVAGLAILNPLGLTFLTAAITHSTADLLWQPVAIGTSGVLAALLVMAVFECYIRSRKLARRPTAGAPEAGSD